jgi:hypothetical protein
MCSSASSAWTSKAYKRAQFGYGLNYLINTEHAMIVDVEATPARAYDEVAATKTMIERTKASFGDACPLKSKCCPKQPQRRVLRDPNEAARDYARSPEFEQSANKRNKVEMCFGHLKTHHRFDRMRLPRLSGTSDEFHLAAIAQNLNKMALRPTRLPVQATAGAAM